MSKYIDELSTVSLVGLDDYLSGKSRQECYDIARALYGDIARLTRYAAYIEARGDELEHCKCVDISNDTTHDVRVALGYHVRSDISF